MLLVSQYFIRIKIYNEEGLETFGDFGIYLGKNGSRKEMLKGLKAQTYSLEGSEVIKTKLKKKDIFKEDGASNYNFVKFAFPNVKEGSIIEVSYRKESPFLYSTPKHFFQKDIPVEYSRFSMRVPQYWTFSPVATGSVPLSKEEKSIAGSNENKTLYTTRNVAPILDDDFVLDIEDYRSSLKYEIHSINYPGESAREFSESWESISDNLLKRDDFGKMMKKKVPSAKKMLASITALPEDEKIVAIYEYVKANVIWNKNYSTYCNQKPEKVLQEKSGNVADINMLLINLLKKAEIEAFPIVTKRRFYGLLNKYYPSLTALDYVFVGVPKNDGFLFLDATSKYSPAGELPIRALNQYGLLIEKRKGKLISIPNNNMLKVKEIAKLELDTKDLSLKGTGTQSLYNYAATKQRIKIDENEDDEDNQELDVEEEEEEEDDDDDEGNEEDEEDDDAEEGNEEDEDLRENIVNISNTSGLEDVYAPIETEFSTTIYEAVQSIKDEIFVDAFVIQEFADNPFANEVRDFPAFFNTKHDHTYISVVNIPNGFELASKPEDITIAMDGGMGQFIYAISADDQKLSVRCLLKIKKTIFLPDDYDILRRFFDTILDKQKEKIVFKKS